MRRLFERSASGLLVPRREPILLRKQRGFVCVNPHNFAAPRVLTYIGGNKDTGAATTYTFLAEPIGTAAADRRVIIAVHGDDTAATYSISSMTVGGVTTTINSEVGSTTKLAAITTTLVPTGTTADVVITFSEAISMCSITVWSAIGMLSNTAIDAGTSVADPSTVTLVSGDNGFGVAAFTGVSANTIVLSGCTERFNSNTDFTRAAGDAITTGSNFVPSGDWSSGSANVASAFATF